MLAHTCKWHLRNTCERHLIPANDVHLSRTNWHTKVYNRVSQRRISTEKRWAYVWHWELPKKKTASHAHEHSTDKSNTSIVPQANSHLLVLIRRIGALPKRASFGYGHTDDVNWYGRLRTTQMGVRQVRARAYCMNGNGRSYGRSAETLLWHVPHIQGAKLTVVC